MIIKTTHFLSNNAISLTINTIDQLCNFAIAKLGANRAQSQACLSYAEVQPNFTSVKLGANREQSQACLSYAEV
ncbi:MAG: hypothetical protein IKY67_02165 [Paludibacteraceae bacterium]|nr:hypothetical protein [Paludibacteraceae bacterium]